MLLSMLSRRVFICCLFAFGVWPGLTARGDDDPIPPPRDPGPGYEGLLPAPVLPPNYVRDQHTIPYGLQSVANTPILHLGQSFRPTRSTIDWAAFVFQNSIQPSDPMQPGPGFLQVRLYSNLNSSNGALSGLLGETDNVSIPSETTSWLVFHFPEPISLTPGDRYYLHVDHTDGYQSWVGIRHQSIYGNGNAFGYFYDTQFNNPPQNLNWGGYDLHFAQGVILPPDPGDFDANGAVDGADALKWQRGESPNGLGNDDLAAWIAGMEAPARPATTAIPEPSSLVLVLLIAGGRFYAQTRTSARMRCARDAPPERQLPIRSNLVEGRHNAATNW